MMAKTAAVIATLNVSVRFVRSATTAPPNSPNSGVRNNPEEGRLYGDEAFRAASGQATTVPPKSVMNSRYLIRSPRRREQAAFRHASFRIMRENASAMMTLAER